MFSDPALSTLVHPRRDADRAPSYSNRSPRPANIDSGSKNSPRCPTNIFYGRIAKNSFSPMLSPVGARSYHPQAFDFNIAAGGMNFYARTLVGRSAMGCYVPPRPNSAFRDEHCARARARLISRRGNAEATGRLLDTARLLERQMWNYWRLDRGLAAPAESI